MSKIYFSRSISRTMSADHPVGDPTGGAAYGEKNDPISAAISLATMYGTASAGFAAMTVMQGITFAGAAMSLVGNVTGNKTLSKIGMITGIAGGIGSFAESKGLFSSGNLKESLGMGTPAGSSGAVTNSGSLSQTPTGNTTVAGNQNINAAYNQNAGANAPPMSPSSVPGVSSQANIAGSPTAVNVPPPSSVTTTTPATQNLFDKSAELGKSAWDVTKSVGSNIVAAVNPITNPYGAMAVGSIAQPISDYLSGKTDAEIDALEAQTGYADARAMQMQEEIATEKRRRANLNAGYAQVNTGITVNPNAYTAQQGLIAQQMQQA